MRPGIGILGRLLLLLAGGGWIVLGSGFESRMEAVPGYRERIPGGPIGSRPEGERDRFLVLGTGASLEGLCRDPLALRTQVLSSPAERVFEPGDLELVLLGRARKGRPARLELGLRGWDPRDRLQLDRGEGPPEALAVIPGSGVGKAVFELPVLESERTLRFLWEGRRGRRFGKIVKSWRLRPGPPPSFDLTEGLPGSLPLAKALEVQGFRKVEDGEGAALHLVPIDRPPPPGLLARVDRGDGLLLLGGPGRRMHPDWIPVAPAVPVPEPRAGKGEGSGDPETRAGPVSDSGAGKDSGKRKGGGPPEGGEGPSDPGPVSKVERRAPPTEGPTRAVALVLVVDDSASMAESGEGGTRKIDMARKGAWATAAQLGDGDEFALIAFGERPRLLLGLGPASRKEALRRALGGLRAGDGKTLAFDALTLAWDQLKRSRAPIRQVVLLTDGAFQDHERPWEEILAAMKREGIGVSALGVFLDVSGAGEFLPLKNKLAEVGGRFLATRRPDRIPRLLLGEVALLVSARKRLVRGKHAKGGTPRKPETPPGLGKGAEAPTRKGPKPPLRLQPIPVETRPVLAGLEEVDWPALEGATPIEASRRARVHLALQPAGTVLQASAPYGLGRVSILAAGAGLGGDGELCGKPWYPKWIAQTAASLLPPDEGRARLEVEGFEIREGDGLPRGVRAKIADLLGAEQASENPAPSQVRVVSRKPPWPWACALALLLALLVLGERRPVPWDFRGARSRERDPRLPGG